MVYVISESGKPLMPTNNAKARILLKNKKAVIVKRTPFTIKLTYETPAYTQPVTLGVDAGYLNIGLSAVGNNKEMFAAEMLLRKDIVNNLSTRRQFRRARRNRKTWYRPARFNNRTKNKKEGWLAPSIQHKVDSHLKIIRLVKSILPVTKIVVEVAAFDIQKIKNPDIEGVEYQNGEQKGFGNVREYVLYRDNHTCQICHGKSKDKILENHHIVSRKVGGNRPENLVTLCKTCHDKVSRGELTYEAKKKRKSFAAESFMNMVRWRIVNQLKLENADVEHTYGYITKDKRINNNMVKSHANDAFCIAGGNANYNINNNYFAIRQTRKCERKLRNGKRSEIPNTIDRYIFGFQKLDKVRYKGKECFIGVRCKSGIFDLIQSDNTIVKRGVSYKKLVLLERTRTLLMQKLHREIFKQS